MERWVVVATDLRVKDSAEVRWEGSEKHCVEVANKMIDRAPEYLVVSAMSELEWRRMFAS